MLVPLDRSSLADAAVRYALPLAAAFGDGLELLTAVDQLGLEARDGRLTFPETERARTHLAEVAAPLHERGLAVETRVLEGDPVGVILRRTEAPTVRAVVMTTRGAGGLDRTVVGSVADAVRRTAHVPVLLVSPNPMDCVASPWQPQRLLVPLDGTSRAEAALGPARELALGLDAKILLVRVERWARRRPLALLTHRRESGKLDEETTLAAAAYLRAVQERAVDGCRVHTIVLRGTAARRLPAFANAEHVDLVVLSSRGRAGLQRYLQPSEVCPLGTPHK